MTKKSVQRMVRERTLFDVDWRPGMQYRIIFACMVLCVSFPMLGKKDYEPDFKLAVIKSNKAKVESLLTRKNKLSAKSIEEMIAWSNDIVEEKTTLERSFFETAAFALGMGLVGMTIPPLFWYITDRDFKRTKETPLQRNATLAKFGACYGVGLIATVIYMYGPRSRLEKAYTTKFSMEKACEDECKKMLPKNASSV